MSIDQPPPPEWMMELRIESGMWRCLYGLWLFAGNKTRADTTREALAERTGQTVRAVKEQLRKLAAAGWIRWNYGDGGWDLAIVSPFEEPGAVPGYVYVVEFSDGRVKVGRSSTPENRLEAHASEARRANLRVTRRWVSTRLRDMCGAEVSLLQSAVDLGGANVGETVEYFTGLDFDAVVAVAIEIVAQDTGGDE